MLADWQTPAAFAAVFLAAAYLVRRAWRKRRAATTGCGSSGEGCGCTVVKKSLRLPAK
jgi:predicted RNA methylase